FNDNPGDLMWTADGNAVRFNSGVGGDQHLYEASLTGNITQITTGERHVNNVSASRDGTIMAYAVNTVFTPGEVFLSKADGSGEVRLTTFNDAWLANVTIVPPEEIHWKVAD